QLRQAIQLAVRNIVERGAPGQLLGQLCQPDAGVDLVQRRIAESGHGLLARSTSILARYSPRPLPTPANCSLGGFWSSTNTVILLGGSPRGGVVAGTRCKVRATMPVQPVWWLAPRPAPLSPWKYS